MLGQHARHGGCPTEGEQWRIGFSRVEWQITTNGNQYQKVPNTPEDNWVWSPQGVVDMHRPEMWGLLQFTTSTAGGASAVAPLPGKPARDLALEIYYAQRDFLKAHNRWATTLVELGLEEGKFPPGVEPPVLTRSKEGYTCAVGFKDGERQRVWEIRQDRRLKLN